MLREIKAEYTSNDDKAAVEELFKAAFNRPDASVMYEVIRGCSWDGLANHPDRDLILIRAGSREFHGHAVIRSYGQDIELNWNTDRIVVRVKNPTLKTLFRIPPQLRRRMFFTYPSGAGATGDNLGIPNF